jgi:hypothetical protein
LESKIAYPAKGSFARYYSGEYFVGEKKLIVSEWVNPTRLGGNPPGVYFLPLPEFPRIPNGRCDETVHIKYAVTPDEIIYEGCGGPPY